MRRRRGGLVGSICPTCRTVQDWSGEHIFRARILCRGNEHVGRHDSTTVVPVVPALAHLNVDTLDAEAGR